MGLSDLYRAVWRWHFYAGLLVLPFMITLSITGALYVYHDEIDNWFHADLKRVQVQDSQRLAPSALVASALDAVPGKAVKYTDPADARASTEITVATEAGKTAVVVLADGRALGVLAIRDEPREDAAAAVTALKAMGVTSVMLTGDNERTGRAIAAGLGMDVRAGLLPEHKLREIEALKARGPVVMVGDGINDAPALAAASVGVAMGGGTAVALETADAALLRERVTGVAELVALSRATLSNVKQNVAVAVGLKLVFLVTTLLGLTGLWPAILADTGATVLVTLNALRLLGWRGPFAT